MEINKTIKYDLYAKGNYIDTFDSMEDVEKYLTAEFERLVKEWNMLMLNEESAIKYVKDKQTLRDYSVIQSTRFTFS